MRRIEYGGQEYLVHTRSGMKLIQALREFGIPVECDCKAGASSAKCQVKFEKGTMFLLSKPTALERSVLGDQVDSGFRLACQAQYK